MDDKNQQYDNLLIGILQNEGNISGFLDAVFGFLFRRTDYYRIMKSKTDKLGFPPGTASNLMVSAFKKYEKITTGDEQKKSKGHRIERDKEKASTVTQQTKNVSDATPEHTEVSNENKTTHRPNQDTEKTVNKSGEQPNTEVKLDSKLQQDIKEDSVPQKSNSAKIEEDANPELARQQAIYQASSESYNGAIRDNYSWSQSITDLDICLKIPNYIKKGKDIKVCIEKKHIKVSHKDESGQMVELMNGELCWEINKEESIWNLVPTEHILINLDKKQERWWEAILTTEPKINVQKIDASRPMTDLDDESQTKIEEMMFNERQKKLGLPQSHEKKVHDVLAQAWNAEGSPFKGQPFDPSKLNVGQGGMITINDSEANKNSS
ncbi:nudC domain-containing protein 3-like [Mytilus trossulus]|uniref:nudC domain-containing protein 3-like n=1 Tax=Mytilus trossulus TaxID=6551 RepID=UPI0030048AE6